MGRDCEMPGEVFGFEPSNITLSLWNCGMSDPVIQTIENVTLVGAGPVNTGDIKDALKLAPFCVAVDGGTEKVRNYGIVPKFVLGDMDSTHEAALTGLDADKVVKISEQDSTDFDKALRCLAVPLVVGVGFLGGRLDHQMAAISTLARYPDCACILLGELDIAFHLPKDFRIDLPPGSRFSVFPMLPGRAQSTGLHWPLDGWDFSVGGMLATSNKVERGPVRIWTEQDGLLAILPRQALPKAADALLRSRQMT